MQGSTLDALQESTDAFMVTQNVILESWFFEVSQVTIIGIELSAEINTTHHFKKRTQYLIYLWTAGKNTPIPTCT